MKKRRETEGLNLDFTDLPTSLAGWACQVLGDACWSWGWDNSEWEGRLVKKIHVIHWRWGREEVAATGGVLYRTGHETGGLDLEKRREKQRSAVGTPASVARARRLLFSFFL